MKKIAIVGLGNWGKNFVREFSKLSEISICYTKGDTRNLKWLKKNYPSIKHTNKYDDILKNNTIDAVVIATPIKTHYRLTTKALKSGKIFFFQKYLIF